MFWRLNHQRSSATFLRGHNYVVFPRHHATCLTFACRSSHTACLMLGDFHLSAKYPPESKLEEERLQVRTVSGRRDLWMLRSELCLAGNSAFHGLCNSGQRVHEYECTEPCPWDAWSRGPGPGVIQGAFQTSKVPEIQQVLKKKASRFTSWWTLCAPAMPWCWIIFLGDYLFSFAGHSRWGCESGWQSRGVPRSGTVTPSSCWPGPRRSIPKLMSQCSGEVLALSPSSWPRSICSLDHGTSHSNPARVGVLIFKTSWQPSPQGFSPHLIKVDCKSQYRLPSILHVP